VLIFKWVNTHLNYYLNNMSRLDGTGPLGQGPMTGRGRGKDMGNHNGNSIVGNRQGGNKECTCPKCSHKEPHTRGIPCSEKKCPKCGLPMKGIFCS
jgi:hypothetical protein